MLPTSPWDNPVQPKAPSLVVEYDMYEGEILLTFSFPISHFTTVKYHFPDQASNKKHAPIT
jgi:hypothetical protein